MLRQLPKTHCTCIIVIKSGSSVDDETHLMKSDMEFIDDESDVIIHDDLPTIHEQPEEESKVRSRIN